MKKFNLLFFAIVCLTFLKCTNEQIPKKGNSINDIVQIENVLTDANGDQLRIGWIKKLWAYIESHIGTHLFNGCQGNSQCGPCPGICLNGRIMNGTIIEGLDVSDEEYADGLRPFKINLMENMATQEEALMIEFKANDVDDIVNDGHFIVDGNVLFNDEMSSSLGKESITMVSGRYPVLFDNETGPYYTFVKFI